MAWFTFVAVYFLFWWLSFFIVLPWGVRSQQEENDVVVGTEPGAPAIHGLGMKLVWTSLVAAVMFAVFYWVYVSNLVSFDQLTTMWGLLKP